MAEFQPSGIFRMGNVPFDNSYKHTMTFGSSSEQNSYFIEVMRQSVQETDYTYIRHTNSVKVPFNREKLYNVNYCMFQNRNYGSKWFYAFVTNVDYINENTSEVFMEIDVMQTWFFNWTRTRCFVEREHVNNDGIGVNTNPEPEIPIRQKVQSRHTEKLGDNMAIIVQSAANPKNVAGGILPSEEPKGDPVDPDLYGGVFNGCQYRVTDRLSAAASTELKSYIANMQRSGIGDSIANIYMVPKIFVRGGGFTNSNTPLDTTMNPASVGVGFSINRPSSLDGYTPRNNKLFVYPYTYAKISDNNGASADLLFEFTPSGNLGINVDGSMEPSGECFVYPANYSGVAQNYAAGISFSASVQCSWPFSSYKNWASQNSFANALTFGINAAMMIVPFVKGAGTAAKTLGAGAKWLSKRGAQANADRVAAATARTAARRGVASATEGIGGMSMGAGALGMASLVASYDRQARQPEVTRGTATGNGVYSTDKLAVNGDVVVPTAEYARIVDDFFSMYGYQVDRVKIPNITGRANWNYVKTANACMRGSVPADDMAAINSILDSGITFWHTSSVGNYNLGNEIV